MAGEQLADEVCWAGEQLAADVCGAAHRDARAWPGCGDEGLVWEEESSPDEVF